jgi:hypothetical protein
LSLRSFEPSDEVGLVGRQPFELAQPLARGGGMRDDGVGRAAVLARKQGEPVVTQLDGVAMSRVDVELVELGAQDGELVVGLGAEAGQARRRDAQGGVESLGFGEQAPGGAQGVEPAAR